MADAVTPHVQDDFAPLNELAKRALRRFGDFSPHSVPGDVMMMFIEFANHVVEEVNQHPYRDHVEPVPYYTDAHQRRPIADQIMLNGLIALYAFQQMSEKTPGYQQLFFQTMNRILWAERNGNTRIQMRPVDGGSRLDPTRDVDENNGGVH